MGAADLKNKARDAFRRKSYDLAVEMYLEALRFAPNDPDAVEGFFQAARKARETKGKAFFGGVLSRMSVGTSRDPQKRLAAAFRSAAKAPESKPVLEALGEAASAAGADAAAVAAWRHLTEVDPENAVAFKHLGVHLGRMGRLKEALDALGEAVRLAPRDQEAIKLRKNLAAEGALKISGYETAASSRELIKDKDVARQLEAETRLQLTPEHAATEIERVRAEIGQDPTNPRLQVRLGDLLLQRKEEMAAIAAFEEAVRLDPRNFDLGSRVGDLKIRTLQRLAREASEAAKARPDDAAARSRREEAVRALLDAQLAEYGRRVQEHPLDLAERFRLGRTLLAAGRVDEAAAEFQQTVRDPSRKTDSLLALAQCFETKGHLSLAVKKLEEALAEFPVLASPRAKEVHYAYGDLLERGGERARAREVFERIYEVDITFRDVSQRLDALARSEA